MQGTVIAFAAETLDGKSPMQARFDAKIVRGHLINYLENKIFTLFPKVWSHLSVQAAALEKYYIRKVLFYKCSTGNKYNLSCSYCQKKLKYI